MRRVLLPAAGYALAALAAACGGHTSSSTSSANASGAPPVAPASVSCTSFASPSATAATRRSLFVTLASSAWSYQYCGGRDCTSLTLDAGGTYSLEVPPGYSGTGTTGARVDSGHWNFAAIDDNSGVVCLDGAVAGATHLGGQENLPSVLHFTFTSTTKEYLQIGPYTFSRTPGTTPSVSPTDNLPNVAVSPGFAALVGANWKKTNAFDVAITPESVVFDQSGGFAATYGGGACPRRGFVSFDRDTLLPQDASRSACPSGYGPGFQAAMVPGFFDDLVVLGQGTYRRSDAASGKPNAFVFDPYGHSVRVYGTYDGALKAGAATTIALTLENTDATLTRTLNSFSATLQPATVSQFGQAQTNGKVTPLATVDLGGVTLAPGEKKFASITVTPPAAGDTFAFAMRLSFTDEVKKYDGAHTFLTAINP